MQLEIIIVTFNNRKLLEKTLPLIVSEADLCNASITIIDNHSSDGTTKFIKNSYPQIKLIALNDNLGFAKANNIGLERSSAKFNMILNPDVIVPLGSIKKMLHWMEINKNVGIMGPKLLNQDGSLQYSCRAFPTPWTYIFELLRLDKRFPNSRIFGRYLMSNSDHNKIMDVDYICGAAMLVSSKCLEEIGRFYEGFFMYAEEAELCWRAKKYGYRVVYWPLVSMIHLGGESTKKYKKEMYSELIRSRWQFFLKTRGVLSALFYLLIATLYSFLSGKKVYTKIWRR